MRYMRNKTVDCSYYESEKDQVGNLVEGFGRLDISPSLHVFTCLDLKLTFSHQKDNPVYLTVD